jgi:hypothetical protein
MFGDAIDVAEVEKAARAFYSDFKKLEAYHLKIVSLMSYSGRESAYDGPLKSMLDRQESLMFGLRNLYVDAYDLLSKSRQLEVFRWIVKATGELRSYQGQLGIAPVVVIAGVLLTAATAGALVSWHRMVDVQGKAISYQESLLPLVLKGELPPDVLKPVIGDGGLSGLIDVIPVLLIGAVVLYGISVFKGKS